MDSRSCELEACQEKRKAVTRRCQQIEDWRWTQWHSVEFIIWGNVHMTRRWGSRLKITLLIRQLEHQLLSHSIVYVN